MAQCQQVYLRAVAAPRKASSLHFLLITRSFTTTISITAFVTLALASLSVANPTAKRHGPGKRGLAWTCYNEIYSPLSSNGLGGLAFIGMQRCKDCDSSPINHLAARQQQLGFTTVFTRNEPDAPGSNYVSPSDAANWYKQNVNPLAIKKALPAVTSSGNSGQGLVATTPNLFNARDVDPGFDGAGSMLYNNDGTISAVGKLLLSA
ncbi:hypothetical protein K438DRAFT_1757652 [Mycena galopus ATCC 62051]|nr:hypothetical protein K438DRAFT_1757652 [Mycena galopus ATCC 62051]